MRVGGNLGDVYVCVYTKIREKQVFSAKVLSVF